MGADIMASKTGPLLIAICLILAAAPAGAGTAHITGPAVVTVDGDPATVEQIALEVIADGSDAARVAGFEWQLGVTGAGLSFDTDSTESMSRALVTDGLHSPAYLLYHDSFGFDAAPSAKGIRAGDLSDSLSAYPPAGLSLGMVVLTVTDEAAALGPHDIQDPDSFFLLDDFTSTEGMEIPPFHFEIVPEPAALTVLALGGLAILRRRIGR